MTTLEFISCAKCGEPLEDELTYCPMCGAVLSPEIFVELEIPQPEEVVIEEQTTDHLRFRLPTFHPPKWRWAMGLCLILFGTGELCPLINMIFRVTNRVPNVIFAVFLGLSGITIITIGVYFWIGVKTFDLRPMHLTIQTIVGRFSFLRKYQVAKIRRISARTPDLKGNFLQEFIASNSQSACRVKFRFRTIYLASGHPPETARFVTQLIRRQLKTMGHELADH